MLNPMVLEVVRSNCICRIVTTVSGLIDYRLSIAPVCTLPNIYEILNNSTALHMGTY